MRGIIAAGLGFGKKKLAFVVSCEPGRCLGVALGAVSSDGSGLAPLGVALTTTYEIGALRPPLLTL